MSETTEPAAPTGEPANGVAGVTDTQTLEQAAQTEASAPSDESPSDDDEGDEQPQQRQSRAERRISHLAARAHNAERQAAEAMALLRQVMAQPGQAQQPQPNAPRAPQADQLAAYVAQQVGPEPNPADYPAGEFDEGFRRAEREWTRRAAAVEAEAKTMQRIQHAQAAQAEQAFRQSFSQQVATIEQTHPGAAEAIGALGHRLHDQVAEAVARMGVDVTLHIATNPEAEARVRSARNGWELAAILGELRGAVKASSVAPSAPQPSKAPPPPAKGVRGASVPTGEPDINNTEAYIEWRRKQRGAA